MKIVVLCSGNLGLTCLNQLARTHAIAAVLTDKKSTGIIDSANTRGIPVFAGNPRSGKGASFLQSQAIQADLMLSINYLFLIEADLISHPRLGAVNFHGSLLPRYRGRTPHVWAIINNEHVTGVTAHFVSDECDAGDIIEQVKVEIQPDDTGGTLLSRFNALYPDLVERVLKRFYKGPVEGKVQDHSQATFFGKRTPEDGLIDWQWQKERIRNWVRAQAYPYPGAFCIYREQRIIVDKVVYDDHGFHSDNINGTILRGGPTPIVKTPNGAIRLETRNPADFVAGERLH